MSAAVAVAAPPSMVARQVRLLDRQHPTPRGLPPTRQGSHAPSWPSCCCRAATGSPPHPCDPARSCCSTAAGSGAARRRRRRQHWAGSACEHRRTAAVGRARSGWRAGERLLRCSDLWHVPAVWQPEDLVLRCSFADVLLHIHSLSILTQAPPLLAAPLHGCSAAIECDVPLETAFALWEDRGRIPQWMPWITSVVVRCTLAPACHPCCSRVAPPVLQLRLPAHAHVPVHLHCGALHCSLPAWPARVALPVAAP